MTTVKEKQSKGSYRQCVLVKEGTLGEYVAWIPTKRVAVGKHVLIDSMPGRWKIVSAGDAKPAYIVESYADNARKGFPSVTGHEEHKKSEG